MSDLIAQLEPDAWRDANPFERSMVDCQHILFRPESNRQELAQALDCWLGENQPCLFGRMEAKQNRLAYCVLTDSDFERGDTWIRSQIQRDRLHWQRAALLGNSHGFLIVAVSERIAHARPGPALLRLATRLCDLYLGECMVDKIHHDIVDLEINHDDRREHRRWRVGVNYFSAQADGRWWRDHRIPGGMAFSMNSVGHMARTRAECDLAKNHELAARASDLPREKLVYFALVNAMKTIGVPQDGGTRGTWLARRGTFSEDREPPTFEVRRRFFGEFAEYSENFYKGLYHTDETIPSVYFDEGLWRRADLRVQEKLAFTYLHSLADEDYLSMGLGIELEPDTSESSEGTAEEGSQA